jgi:glutamate-5-semialdehyde dehydrogenase
MTAATVTKDSKRGRGRESVESYMRGVGERARASSRAMAKASTGEKNAALFALAKIIEDQAADIIEANAADLRGAHEGGLDEAMIERLQLNPGRIEAMANGVRQVAGLPDPIGEMFDLKMRPSGIQVGHMRVPLGVVGIIYESRPNVTADAAALCLKSGNACVLRGGSEALQSNQAIALCIARALRSAGLPADAVQVVDTPDRAAVGQMLIMPQFIDVIIPRGGKSLVARVSEEARVPVIKHLDGNCHVYIDSEADIEKAIAIAVNAKTQRYGTCNTMESLLVDEPIAERVLPELGRIYQGHGVELRGCERTRKLLSNARPAKPDDWVTEYLAPIL